MSRGSSTTNPIVLSDSSSEDEGQISAAPPTRKRARSSNGFLGQKTFCLIIMVEPSTTCHKFITDCRSNCPKKVNNACLQFDNTLHFTLFSGRKLTYEQTMSITYRNSSNAAIAPFLPNFHLTGLMNWKNCIALATDTNIDDTIASIETSFDWRVNANDTLHLSLYRMRGFSNEKKNAFQRIRSFVALANIEDYGMAQGTKLVLKEMGAAYDGSDGSFFRAIHESKG